MLAVEVGVAQIKDREQAAVAAELAMVEMMVLQVVLEHLILGVGREATPAV
jgi:hypothetical protein